MSGFGATPKGAPILKSAPGRPSCSLRHRNWYNSPEIIGNLQSNRSDQLIANWNPNPILIYTLVAVPGAAGLSEYSIDYLLSIHTVGKAVGTGVAGWACALKT